MELKVIINWRFKVAGTKAKGKINSRAKGCRGELEACELLRSFGIAAHRGQQFKGTKDSPDVVSELAGWHIEVKRVESFNAYKAIEQAQADMGAGEKALVLHKRNGKPWLIVMTAESVLPLLAGSVGLGVEKRAQGGAEVAKTTALAPNEILSSLYFTEVAPGHVLDLAPTTQLPEIKWAKVEEDYSDADL